MIFYNGFNLVLDIAIGYFSYRVGKSFGFSNGYRQAEDDIIPF